MRGVLVLVAALTATGCSGTFLLRAAIPRPAELSVDRGVAVLVTHDGTELAEAIAFGLQGTVLACGAVLVTGEVAPTLRIQVSASDDGLVEGPRTPDPDAFCAPGLGPCSTRPGSSVRSSVRRGHVVVELFDAATGALQSSRAAEAAVAAGAGSVARLRAALLDAARALFEASELGIAVPLVEVDVEGARSAFAAAREGNFVAARAGIEALVAAGSFAELPRGVRADLLFDLGQLCRVAALAGDAAAGEGALAALRSAAALRPNARTEEAIDALARDHAGPEPASVTDSLGWHGE